MATRKKTSPSPSVKAPSAKNSSAPHRSLSVVVPALNEAAHIAATIETVNTTVRKYFKDWEILVFNDGSTDRTGEIAAAIAKKDKRVKVIHHSTPQNLGACYKEGLQMAKKEYIIMIPGDNECGAEVMEPVFQKAGTADIVVPFTSNAEVRPMGRRLLSRAFVMLTNTISGCHLKYYNGAVLHKTAIIQKCGIATDGFGYQAEALIKLLRNGASYVEVGTRIVQRPSGKSKALRLNNVIKVARFMTDLLVESRIAPLRRRHLAV